MSHPLLWPPKTFFYPVGNTSAICLTQDIGPEQPADVLLLGCGDPRNVLYTVCAERRLSGISRRNLDVTCLDLEPAILARNIVLYSLLKSQVNLNLICNIFYHFTIDRVSLDVLVQHAQKLADASSTMESWTHSEYGLSYKMCNSFTLAEMHRHWKLYTNFESIPPNTKKNLQSQQVALVKRVLDQYPTNFPASRSAGMCWPDAIDPVSEAFRSYWKTGTMFTSKDDLLSATKMNPMFLRGADGDQFDMHYGTCPFQAFHLLPVFASASGHSKKPDLQRSLREQFTRWGTAFRQTVADSPGFLTLRFCTGDVFAFCHTIHQKQDTKRSGPAHYIHQWSSEEMCLDSGDQPCLFDVIDTSNLIDHTGLLNILLVTEPLLKKNPTSTLYTEALLPTGGDAVATLPSRMCGDVATMSLMLGLVPRSFVSTFNTHSNTHELLYNAGPKTQQHERIPWCRPVSGDPLGNDSGALCLDPVTLGKVLFRIYDKMHKDERVFDMLTNPVASINEWTSITHYNRRSFAYLLRHLKTRIALSTEYWEEAVDRLRDLIEEDRSRLVGMNNFQDLCLQLHLAGVSTTPYLSDRWSTYPGVFQPGVLDVFRGWNILPSVVCVTLVVPRQRLDVLGMKGDIGSFPLTCHLTSSTGQDNNFSTTIQAVPGKLDVMLGSPLTISILEDRRGIKHADSLIVSCLVPSWILAFPGTRVALAVKSTPHTTMAFASTLGMALDVFSVSLGDSDHVHITPRRPGIGFDAPSVFRGVPSVTPLEGTSVTVEMDAACLKVHALTARLDLKSRGHMQPLEAQIRITATQVSACSMTVYIGTSEYSLGFPYPIDGSSHKLRVARKSLYVEIVAPLANASHRTPGGYSNFELSPVIKCRGNLITWNVHDVDLDVMPILDLSDRKKLDWISIQTSLQFSDRERHVRQSISSDLVPASEALVSVKDSIHSLFSMACGSESGSESSKVIGLACDIPGVGAYAILFVQHVRLDPASFSIIADVSLVPLDHRTMGLFAPGIQALLNSKSLRYVSTTPAEATAWKRLMPAFVERCRSWSHGPNCEYEQMGRIPLSLEPDETPICSCGRGLGLPKSIPGVPAKAWKLLRPFATRAALSPLFAVSYVEPVATIPKGLSSPQPADARACEKCGKAGKLQCSKCKHVRYCSKECSVADWSRHKNSCKRS